MINVGEVKVLKFKQIMPNSVSPRVRLGVCFHCPVHETASSCPRLRSQPDASERDVGASDSNFQCIPHGPAPNRCENSLRAVLSLLITFGFPSIDTQPGRTLVRLVRLARPLASLSLLGYAAPRNFCPEFVAQSPWDLYPTRLGIPRVPGYLVTGHGFVIYGGHSSARQ
eukprot:3414004-Rhodomonas_salina.1